MKFNVEYGDFIENRVLTYINDEFSFDMEPIVNKIDFEVILNKLSLSVINNNIIQLWGFCGLDKSMKSTCKAPYYKSGRLKIEDRLDFGFAYGISDNDFPVNVNAETGWVCIGDPEKKGNAVEFIKNCVAVINDDNKFISLWLKPKTLPYL